MALSACRVTPGDTSRVAVMMTGRGRLGCSQTSWSPLTSLVLENPALWSRMVRTGARPV